MYLQIMFFIFACIPEFPKPVIDYPEDRNKDADGDNITENQGDCDDSRSDVYPDAPEVCDEVDNNCNGIIDTDTEDLPYWYQDSA